MNRIVLILVIALSCVSLRAQTSFSCTHREYCQWNSVTKKFEGFMNYDESSLFVMNKSETLFIHTTETMKSTYYVKSREYNEEKKIWSYNVTSDVGNKYYYVFDPKNRQVRAVFTKDNKVIMIVFTVKSIF